eukprot:716151-Prymnesium_polylepis.1
MAFRFGKRDVQPHDRRPGGAARLVLREPRPGPRHEARPARDKEAVLAHPRRIAKLESEAEERIAANCCAVANESYVQTNR